MVFNVIVSSPRQVLCNLGPFVPVFSMGSNDNLVLFWSPFASFDLRVQMVMPSLSALLPNSPGQIA